jgi:hypothetical protein
MADATRPHRLAHNAQRASIDVRRIANVDARASIFRGFRLRARTKVLMLSAQPNRRPDQSCSHRRKSWTDRIEKTVFHAKCVNRKIFKAPHREASFGATHCFSESISQSRN